MTKRISAVAAVMAVLVALVVAFSVPATAKSVGHGKKVTRTQKHGKGSRDSRPENGRDGAQASAKEGDELASNADGGENLHPSGKDRSVENGGSGIQGNSDSAPDEDGHGPERDFNGTDKPGETGGLYTADQDGNNGCGNDDDFEDDNEGWCGQKPPAEVAPETVAPAEEVCPAEDTMTDDEALLGEATCGDDVTLPETIEDDTETLAPTTEVPTDDVLGIVIRRGTDDAARVAGEATGERAALPFTGGDVLALVVIGAALLVTGIATTRIRREGR